MRAMVGAMVLGLVTAWADATRTPGEPQSLMVRVVSAAMIAAAFGGLLQWALPDWSAANPSALVGGITGAIGFRIEKTLLGLGLGVVVGLVFDSLWPDGDSEAQTEKGLLDPESNRTRDPDGQRRG